jgi:hypothetical protein
MKVYSDKLTLVDLRAALPMGVFIEDLEVISKPRTRNDATGVRYKQGWNIYLSGSSVRMGQHDRYTPAATWDEWGIWMAELYRLDPDVKIGWYKSHEDFISQTTHMRDHYANRNTMVAREHRAPWLKENENIMMHPIFGSFAARSTVT